MQEIIGIFQTGLKLKHLIIMIEIVKSDLFRYIPKEYSLSVLFKGMRSQGFRYMFFRRMVDRQGKKPVIGLLLKWRLRHYTYRYGFQIGGTIGKGFYIGHFGTIIVSTQAVIGDNCNISPGVVIGATRRGENRGAPLIGDLVWIGSNAVIVGKIKIGSNVLIAPGAYVNFDVPDNSIVIGNPGVIKQAHDATKGYINNIYVSQ